MLVLSGDIGGTHARLALIDTEPGTRVLADRTGSSQEIEDLTGYISHFLEAIPSRPDRVCLAIAGPVVGQKVTGTNLPWRLDATTMQAELGVPSLRFINDFEAVGYGLDLLQPADLETLQPGETDPDGTIGIIGAGTGLGEGLVVRIGDSAEGRAVRGRPRHLFAPGCAKLGSAQLPRFAIRGSRLLGTDRFGTRVGRSLRVRRVLPG